MTSGATGHSPRAQDRNLVRKESDLVRKESDAGESFRTDHSSGIAETPYAVWHLGEGPSEIDGRMVYLSRVIDLEGDILDVFVQSQRNKHAALKLMRQFAPTRHFHVFALLRPRWNGFAAADARLSSCRRQPNRDPRALAHRVRDDARRVRSLALPGSHREWKAMHPNPMSAAKQTGKGMKAHKIGQKKQAPPLVRPHIFVRMGHWH
jgi:transposase-like protein